MDMSNGFFREILDKLNDRVYFVDRDRKITYWNSGAERITGYRKDEVIGSRCCDNLLMHVDKDSLMSASKAAVRNCTRMDGSPPVQPPSLDNALSLS